MENMTNKSNMRLCIPTVHGLNKYISSWHVSFNLWILKLNQKVPSSPQKETRNNEKLHQMNPPTSNLGYRNGLEQFQRPFPLAMHFTSTDRGIVANDRWMNVFILHLVEQMQRLLPATNFLSSTDRCVVTWCRAGSVTIM